jgi:hypothetical protein
MSLMDRRRERAAASAATDGAAQMEVDRLVALEPEDLAVELMPAFGPDGAKSRGRIGTGPLQVIEWLMKPVGRGVSTKPLVPVVLAGLQALEHAGLVQERTSGVGTGARFYSLTPRGETALADGSAATYIKR